MNRRPNPVAIDETKLRLWERRFRYYREPPDEEKISGWIEQFSRSDIELATKVLDNVEIVSEKAIQQGYKKSALRIPGWKEFFSKRQTKNGRIVIVGFGKAGESGPAMVRIFREATGLSSSKFDGHFHSITDIPGLGLTALDTLIFVDDFSGTGNQIASNWPVFEELIASEAKCFLLLSAMTTKARETLGAIKRFRVIANRILASDKNVFSDKCKLFAPNEKATILTYCKMADKKNPMGFGSCGLLFVLSHKTPNNSLPILHTNHNRWSGLFPRYLNV